MNQDEKQSIRVGLQIKSARQLKKWTQAELARRCRLNIRTIQRIENNETIPHLFTLKIIEEVLDIQLHDERRRKEAEPSSAKLMDQFKKRRRLRLYSLISVFVVLFLTLLLIFSGIPKAKWAPFICGFFALYLLFIAQFWRCPGCNKLLSDSINPRFCAHCGLRFEE